MTRLRVGLIGCGNWGAKLARNLVACPAFRLAGVCDRRRELADQTARLHAADDAWDDAAAFLEYGGLDAVVIATPARTHAELARRALERDLHVLCEKPLALSADVGGELFVLAAHRGRVVLTDHTELYSGPFRLLAERVARGDVGAVRSIALRHANVAAGPADLDLVWDLAPHDFALLEALGAGELRSVAARVAGNGADLATLEATFATGIAAEVRLARGATERRRELEVRGASGMLRAAGFRPGDPVFARREAADGARELTFAGDDVEPLRRLVETFAARLHERPDQRTAAEGELRILHAVEAAAAATARARRDAVEPATVSIGREVPGEVWTR